jgi:hypothetical protein
MAGTRRAALDCAPLEEDGARWPSSGSRAAAARCGLPPAPGLRGGPPTPGPRLAMPALPPRAALSRGAAAGDGSRAAADARAGPGLGGEEAFAPETLRAHGASPGRGGGAARARAAEGARLRRRRRPGGGLRVRLHDPSEWDLLVSPAASRPRCAQAPTTGHRERAGRGQRRPARVRRGWAPARPQDAQAAGAAGPDLPLVAELELWAQMLTRYGMRARWACACRWPRAAESRCRAPTRAPRVRDRGAAGLRPKPTGAAMDGFLSRRSTRSSEARPGCLPRRPAPAAEGQRVQRHCQRQQRGRPGRPAPAANLEADRRARHLDRYFLRASAPSTAATSRSGACSPRGLGRPGDRAVVSSRRGPAAAGTPRPRAARSGMAAARPPPWHAGLGVAVRARQEAVASGWE